MPFAFAEVRRELPQIQTSNELFVGGRFTVKTDQSVKGVTEDEGSHARIELLPPNRDYNPIPVTHHEGPEMVVAGEEASSIN